MSAPAEPVIVLVRLRAFYTTRRCRVQITYYVDAKSGLLVREHVELSCLLLDLAPPTTS